MEEFAKSKNLSRKSNIHRDIYLSDFRKVPENIMNTILRFQLKKLSIVQNIVFFKGTCTNISHIPDF